MNMRITKTYTEFKTGLLITNKANLYHIGPSNQQCLVIFPANITLEQLFPRTKAIMTVHLTRNKSQLQQQFLKPVFLLEIKIFERAFFERLKN